MFCVQACLLALGLLALAGADSTGTTEVDIVFPRNDTYELMPLMPVVFAVQNPAAVQHLYTTLEYLVWPEEGPYNGSFNELRIDMVTPNETTQFLSEGIPNLLNTEGKWGFSWRLRSTNCSTSDDGTAYNDDHMTEDYDGFHRRTSWSYQYFRFTTAKGGRQPNLTAITTGEDCGKTQGIAFDVKQNLEVPFALTGNGPSSCALLASPAPTPSPCRASVVPSIASSISARITQAECYAATPAVSCPPKKDGAAVNSPGIQAALLAGPAWILYNVLF
ncbi:unnamed protein product [Penicillium egyptiacum]|uniref:DUF7136 domain-containing protein n=1 Tax=Penicillium egyptiacum TaxID=1303716 RepID=A0A9W4K6D9_9EURO|nr:unnamed protein product [Penicillium egyptiacum]